MLIKKDKKRDYNSHTLTTHNGMGHLSSLTYIDSTYYIVCLLTVL